MKKIEWFTTLFLLSRAILNNYWPGEERGENGEKREEPVLERIDARKEKIEKHRADDNGQHDADD